MWSLEKLPARLSKGFSARFSANCDNELGFERCYFQTGLKSFSQNFSQQLRGFQFAAGVRFKRMTDR